MQDWTPELLTQVARNAIAQNKFQDAKNAYAYLLQAFPTSPLAMEAQTELNRIEGLLSAPASQSENLVRDGSVGDDANPILADASDTGKITTNYVLLDNTAQFQTGLGVAKFCSFMGWVAVVFGLLSFVSVIFSSGSISLIVGGFLVVASGQISRATLLTARCNLQMLALRKQELGITEN